MIQRIKRSITHQGIGGKEFKIDEQVTKTLTPNEVSEKGIKEGNPACWNFMDRREDFTLDFPHKLYYVKVDGLGYIIAQDEIEIILEPHEDLNNINLDPDDINGSGSGSGAMASATPKHEHKIDPIAEAFAQGVLIGIENPTVKDLSKSISESIEKGFMQGGIQ